MGGFGAMGGQPGSLQMPGATGQNPTVQNTSTAQQQPQPQPNMQPNMQQQNPFAGGAGMYGNPMYNPMMMGGMGGMPAQQ